MNIQRKASGTKKATNLSLSEDLIAEAKELGINLSQAAETGLAKAVADEKVATRLPVVGAHCRSDSTARCPLASARALRHREMHCKA